MTDEQYWIKNSAASSQASAEVDRLVGLYESTQTPGRAGTGRSDPPRTSSEVDRLIALAKRNERADSQKSRRG